MARLFQDPESKSLTISVWPWPVWPSWVEHRPINQKVADSIAGESWSGHMPRLRVLSQVRVHARGNPSMFLSHMMLLSLSLPSPVSKVNGHVLW